MLKCLFIAILLSSPLLAVAPVSEKIGPVAVDIESGSITETALSAVSEPFTEEWLEKYTAEPMKAGEVLAPVLSSALPLDDPVAGMESSDIVDILDLTTGTVYSFLFRDGKIALCYPSYSAESPEL